MKLSSKDLPHTFCEAVSPASTEGAPSSGLRPCIRSHPRERVLGGPRCHREEVTSNPLHRNTLLCRIQCASSRFAIAALYYFHSLLSDATRPWTQAASAKRRPTRHLRSPTAARPRRSSWWYVSLSSILSPKACIACSDRVQVDDALLWLSRRLWVVWLSVVVMLFEGRSSPRRFASVRVRAWAAALDFRPT